MVQDSITILIKTFLRPKTCQRLIDSIRKFYPEIKIMVAVDDDWDIDFEKIDKQFNIPFDSGVSKGKNLLVENCETPYCLIIDDDCIFTEETDLQLLLEDLETRNLDIVQAKVAYFIQGITFPREAEYRGLITEENGVVRYNSGDRDGLYDFIINVFLAKTDVLKNHKWDEELKLGEHASFFRRYKGQMRIGYCERCTIIHNHETNPEYELYRNRAIDFIKLDMRKNNISKRIDVWGVEITL